MAKTNISESTYFREDKITNQSEQPAAIENKSD